MHAFLCVQSSSARQNVTDNYCIDRTPEFYLRDRVQSRLDPTTLLSSRYHQSCAEPCVVLETDSGSSRERGAILPHQVL
jgi:hypothetical protein